MPRNAVSGRPGGSASPTGRMPHERSRAAIDEERVTSSRSSSTSIHPSHVPTWAKRLACSVTRLSVSIACGSSMAAGNSPRHVRSAAIPSVRSSVRRSSCSGSITSSR